MDIRHPNSKYRIFDYCWHIPDQYDMVTALNRNCEFHYCLTSLKQWDTRIRPLPEGLHFVTHYEPGSYDLAILHMDQQIFFPVNKQIMVYTELNEQITDIPKIVINHGSPVLPEAFTGYAIKYTQLMMEDKIRKYVHGQVGDNTMVVTSYTAASGREWGFGIPLIPGMDPDDWRDLPKEPRVFATLPLRDLEKYYNTGCLLDTGKYLQHDYGYMPTHVDHHIPDGNTFEKYRNYLGSSLLYLDTSTRTPINRGRTEAFLSGCCVLQVTGAHDCERWARDGENMILVPDDAKKIASVIADILENRYEEAIAIGQRGKQMAIQQFNRKRYRDDWLKLFNTLTHG